MPIMSARIELSVLQGRALSSADDLNTWARDISKNNMWDKSTLHRAPTPKAKPAARRRISELVAHHEYRINANM